MASETLLTCDMVKGCQAPVTHIDIKGYVYCRVHGRERKDTCRCRQLTAAELRTLRSGEPLRAY
jgi:hypothetical protein